MARQMKPTYQIKDWDKHFENHESRKLKKTCWVSLPNRHDGKSYRRIASHPEGVAIFAAWTLILEVASKMPTRGVLADEDGPLDSEDLASMTGFPAAIFDSAFNLLTQERFGWLVTGNGRGRAAKSPAISRNLPQSPAVPGKIGLVQNRTEQYGTEQNKEPFAAQARQVFGFWQDHLNHPKAVMDSKRAKAITARLKDGYSTDDLTAAIRGCKLTPYNMGENDRKQVYDDIELICRDATHVENFIARVSQNGSGIPRALTVKEKLAAGVQV